MNVFTLSLWMICLEENNSFTPSTVGWYSNCVTTTTNFEFNESIEFKEYLACVVNPDGGGAQAVIVVSPNTLPATTGAFGHEQPVLQLLPLDIHTPPEPLSVQVQ